MRAFEHSIAEEVQTFYESGAEFRPVQPSAPLRIFAARGPTERAVF
jgi:hypothetical protein